MNFSIMRGAKKIIWDWHSHPEGAVHKNELLTFENMQVPIISLEPGKQLTCKIKSVPSQDISQVT